MSQHATPFRIEFDDYFSEWMLPIVLAEENQEPAPLLLCAKEDNSHLSNIAQEIEPPCLELKELVSFSCQIDSETQIFCLLQITDRTDYHMIWEGGYHRQYAPLYVFSHDCDLNQLRKILTGAPLPWLNKRDALTQISNWCYWVQVYGMSDWERYACFQSKTQNHIEQFATLLKGESYLKRFDHIHTTRLDARLVIPEGKKDGEEALTFLEQQNMSSLQKGCYLLYFTPTDFQPETESKEDYCQWQMRRFPDDGMPSDEEYEDWLSTMRDYNKQLAPLSSLPNAAEINCSFGQFRLIPIEDISLLYSFWGEYSYCDRLMALFSLDTPVEKIRLAVMQSPNDFRPLKLLHHGEWAMIRSRLDSELWDVTLSVKKISTLAPIIACQQAEYIEGQYNTQPAVFP